MNVAVLALSGAIVLAGVLAGCASSSSTMHTQTVPDAGYKAALERTDPAKFALPGPGSDAEVAMLGRFEALFTNYSYENLEVNIERVYAPDVYFRDAFKQFDSAAGVKKYILAGLAPLDACEFVFNRIIRSEGEFYVDWTMRLDFKKTPPGTWEETIGMTHIRFNSEGQVIFHQDYWDPTDIVYRRIPIARQLIAYVKKKL